MRTLLAVVLIGVVGLTGCRTASIDTQPSSLTSVKQAIVNQAQSIQNSASTIDDNTDKPVIQTEVGKLKAVSSAMLTQSQSLTKINDAYNKLQAENKKLTDDIKRFIDKKLAYVWITAITIAFIGVIAGIAIIAVSKGALGTIGIEVIIISIGALGVAYALAYYPTIAILTGIVLLIGGSIVLVSSLLKANKQREIEVTELVRTTELVKTEEWNDKTKKQIQIIQSPEVQKTVAKVKKKDKMDRDIITK